MSTEDLVIWAIRLRRTQGAGRLRAAVMGAISPQLIDRALEMPAIAARLDHIPADRRGHALSALAVIVGTPHLNHASSVRLGRRLAVLRGASQAEALSLAVGSPQENAVRLIGNALVQAGKSGPCDLIEFVDLMTQWADLDIRSRSRFLVDFHAAPRA